MWMRFFSIPSFFIALFFFWAAPAAAQKAVGSTRVEELLARMTLEEKVGQMTQLALDDLSVASKSDTTGHKLDPVRVRDAIVNRHVGAIQSLNLPAFTQEHWAQIVKAMQDIAVGETRLRIPMLFAMDAVHGVNFMEGATLFPQNLAMAATWNRDLVQRENEITAIEMRAAGISWNFSPVLDIGRQPLWSRFFETYGEDVFLAAELGAAAVRGLQDADAPVSNRVAASGEHFLGYSLPLSGKDRTPAWIPDRMLREYVLPPFVRAINEGVAAVVVSPGEINGEPVAASRRLLTDLLRDELGFQGVIVGDWGDIAGLHSLHRVASTDREAVRMAMEAGIDMSKVPHGHSFADQLIGLVHDGEISEQRIDTSVRRILQLKFDLGLFDDPYPKDSLVAFVGSEEFADASRRAAEEAITLLRNEDAVLPLTEDARLLVTGPGASSLPALHGALTYTLQGNDESAYPDSPTIVDAIVTRRGLQRTAYVPGTTWTREISIGAAVEEAFRSDAVVAVLGEDASAGRPGDVDELDLPDIQLRLVESLAAVGRPIILVLTENRPRIVRRIVPLVDAVIMAYEPGPYGAEAIAGILSGDVNPSGRLPFTYPRYSGSIIPYDHKNAERADRNGGRNAFNPQWEFGEGLSYTSFSYRNLRLASDTLSAADTLKVTVDVTNDGSRRGKAVVQVYVGDEYATVAPSVKRLRAFDKIAVDPSATKQARFSIPVSSLGFWGIDGSFVVEPGRFKLFVGNLQKAFVVR